jgi:hypothetical protein
MMPQHLTAVFTRWLAGCAAVLLAAAPLFAQVVDPTEAALRILRRAVSVQRDGSHLPLLFALRQLHDPDLRPLFEKLLPSEQWQIQVHGALGLAETSDDKTLDIEVLKSLAPQAQDAAIATGLDLDLLSAGQLPQILAWPELQPMARLVALAELVSLEQAAPADQLRDLCMDDDVRVASLAAALLAQSGDSSALTSLRARLDNFPRDRKLETDAWLLDAIRRYRLTACADWVKQILDTPPVQSELAHRAVFTLLTIAPQAGIEAWKRQLAESPAMHHRVRYALILLGCSASVPTSVYDQLQVQRDEELLARIVSVGKALATKSDPVQAIIYLLDAQHMKSTEWAMEHTPKLPDEQAARIYAHLIDRLADEKSDGEAVALAVRASAKLMTLDPEGVFARLGRAPDDGVQQQAILLGMFETDLPRAAEAARTVKRLGTGRADSLALLLIAKYSPALEQSDIDLLGKIASGGGRISEVLQVQAAWLYLKHTKQLDKSMTALFPPPG